jgi:hypothetical protein
MLTVENGTSEVTDELLEKVGLLGRDFVETIALATLLDVGRGKTSSELSVEVCNSMLAKFLLIVLLISHAAQAGSLVEPGCMIGSTNSAAIVLLAGCSLSADHASASHQMSR